jgi:hypothetical protein
MLGIVIIAIISSLILIVLISNISTVRTWGKNGYKTYFKILRLLFRFKKVDIKLKHEKTLIYNFVYANQQQTKTKTDKKISYDSWYFVNNKESIKIVQISDAIAFEGTSLEHYVYSEEKKDWITTEYRIDVIKHTDIILKLIFKHINRKINKAKVIDSDDKNYFDIVNRKKTKKNRIKNLDSILD